jgi:hypothetical protein
VTDTNALLPSLLAPFGRSLRIAWDRTVPRTMQTGEAREQKGTPRYRFS